MAGTDTTVETQQPASGDGSCVMANNVLRDIVETMIEVGDTLKRVSIVDD